MNHIYMISFVTVVLFAIVGYIYREIDVVLYNIESVILTLMLCLRYGQGTDYFSYEKIYYRLFPAGFEITDGFKQYGPLFGLIIELCKTCGMSTIFFIGLWSFFMMLMTYIGIRKMSGLKTLSILLLFPTYYLTFYYGALRQGFALSMVLCFILPSYVRKNWLRYGTFVALSSMIHYSAAILLIIPIINRMKKSKRACIIVSLLAGLIFGLVIRCLSEYSEVSQIDHVGPYLQFTPSYLAVAVRILMMLIVTILYRVYSKSSLNCDSVDSMYDLYFIGFCIYISTCPIALLSHRLTAYMKISEVILIPCLVLAIDKVAVDEDTAIIGSDVWSEICLKSKRYIVFAIMLVMIVETIKNLNSYSNQGGYYHHIPFYNYPYVSVFNSQDIYMYRENIYNDTTWDVCFE